MELRAKIEDVSVDYFRKCSKITLVTDQKLDGIEELMDKGLSVSLKKYAVSRSKDANALLWACLNEIAVALNTDKWSVYLMMLKRYGKFTYICVKPAAVEAVKRQWRECEEVGRVNINGTKAVQLLCYYGSSTYDTKEFSVLLNGVISEMEEMRLPTPPSTEIRRYLEEWEKYGQKNGGKKHE